MALIKCPECNSEVSSQAKECPRCGYPIANIQQTSSKSNTTQKSTIQQPKSQQPATQKTNGNSMGCLPIVIIIFILIGLLGSCSDSDDDYRDTLESGQQKYYSGEEMTEEEYNAVKSFNEWKDKQSDKTYDDWDD